jgi:hypothetical protein
MEELIAERDKKTGIWVFFCGVIIIVLDAYLVLVGKSTGSGWIGVFILLISLFVFFFMPKTAITREGGDLVVHHFTFYKKRIRLADIEAVGCGQFSKGSIIHSVKNDIRVITITMKTENGLKNVSVGAILNATNVSVLINEAAKKVKEVNDIN